MKLVYFFVSSQIVDSVSRLVKQKSPSYNDGLVKDCSISIADALGHFTVCINSFGSMRCGSNLWTDITDICYWVHDYFLQNFNQVNTIERIRWFVNIGWRHVASIGNDDLRSNYKVFFFCLAKQIGVSTKLCCRLSHWIPWRLLRIDKVTSTWELVHVSLNNICVDPWRMLRIYTKTRPLCLIVFTWPIKKLYFSELCSQIQCCVWFRCKHCTSLILTSHAGSD